MNIKGEGYSISTSSALQKLSAFLQRRKYSRHFIICDENTLSSCLALLISEVPVLAGAEVIETESGEQNKSIEVCAGIWQTLAEAKADRDAVLINVGGGVVCDMGGFCAAVYKRGIDFIQVPTSLLAMCDAAIGGKTGVDLANVKNIVGAFANPAGVFIDQRFLATLPERHFYNGLAEVFKIALVLDADLFDYLEKKQGAADIGRLISQSVALKNAVVRKDPFDKAGRRLLNFGHTIGHALEAQALEQGQDVLHGEAVVAGMIAEAHVAMQKKMLGVQKLRRLASLLLGFYDHLPAAGNAKTLLDYMGNDKKNQRGKINCTLLTDIGKGRINVPVSAAEVRKALGFYGNLLDAAT